MFFLGHGVHNFIISTDSQFHQSDYSISTTLCILLFHYAVCPVLIKLLWYVGCLFFRLSVCPSVSNVGGLWSHTLK